LEIALKHKKSFMIFRVVKHWNRFPRDAVKSPFLMTFKTSLNMALSKQLDLTQVWAGRLD